MFYKIVNPSGPGALPEGEDFSAFWNSSMEKSDSMSLRADRDSFGSLAAFK